VGSHFGDQDVDLHRLELVREDLAKDLGVLVGEAASIDVVTAVLEALDVGRPDTGHPELVELVVATHAGEGDAVVDLADLAQRVRRVLGGDGDAVVVDECDQAAASRDALAGEVGAVLHRLFRRDVERHAHCFTPRSRAAMASNRRASSSSLTRSNPPAVIVATVG
jgi:hypothetical protein